MKKSIMLTLLVTVLTVLNIKAQESKEIRLLVRGDDMGMTHSVNKAIIESYKDGVMKSVELMVPCPWFPEAVKLLKENPGLEVGIHLVLTSEWEGYKWRPLTDASSIVDENGYFFPMAWENKNYPNNLALINVNWDSKEVEKELRAQIDLALKHIPRINHLSSHMYVINTTPEFKAVFEKVAKSYNLKLADDINIKKIKIKNGKDKTPKEKEAAFVAVLEELQPGTWMFVDHPAFDTPEMQAITHRGYNNVGMDRAGITAAFTSKKVQRIIKRRNIKLITYQDLFD